MKKVALSLLVLIGLGCMASIAQARPHIPRKVGKAVLAVGHKVTHPFNGRLRNR